MLAASGGYPALRSRYLMDALYLPSKNCAVQKEQQCLIQVALLLNQ
jgi:hypothetical protein